MTAVRTGVCTIFGNLLVAGVAALATYRAFEWGRPLSLVLGASYWPVALACAMGVVLSVRNAFRSRRPATLGRAVRGIVIVVVGASIAFVAIVHPFSSLKLELASGIAA
ncbi:MAG: hypothetical protein KDB80_06210, partial [Planctomycetes bacterium]|nr:hypothetical protein [Planctomycetota bacterium]